MDPAALEGVRRIYESSFTAAERVDFEELREGLDAGERRLFLAEGDDGSVTAFGTTVPLAPPRGQLLEYFAVAEEARGTGIGGGLLEDVLRALREEGTADLLFWEVEPPETRDAERRIAFYRGHGARLAECAPHYRAPSSDGEGELRYLLMWAPLAEGAAEPRGEVLRELVRALLVDVYGLDPGAPLVAEVLGALAC